MAGLTINAIFSCTDLEEGQVVVTVSSPDVEDVTVFVVRDGVQYTSGFVGNDNTVSFGNLPNGEYEIYATGSVNGNSNSEYEFLNCSNPADPESQCNLAITDVITDGSTVTVTASGANGVTEYSLDQFETVQETNVFQGVAPGNHIMYARDKVNPRCIATYLFKVWEAYGSRYHFSFEGVHNSNVQCLIYKKGYTGPSEEIEIKGGSPLTIKMSDADEFAPIRGAECTITIMAQTARQYEELFTADEREYRIEVYSGSNPSLMEWSGYLLPNVFQYPHLPAPYTITLSATDGIGDLKQVDFRVDNTRFLPDFISVYDAIRLCLYQLDLPLKVLAAVDVAGAGMDAAISPLKQAQLSYMFAYDGDKIKNSYDALGDILTTFRLKINQNRGGRWFIVPQKSTVYNGFYFDKDGRAEGVATFDPTIEIKTPTTGWPIYINGSQLINISPGYKKQVINFPYGDPINMVPTGAFTDDDRNPDLSPKGWDHVHVEGSGLPARVLDGHLTLEVSTTTPAENHVQSPPYFLKRISALEGRTPIRVAFSYVAVRLASGKESQDVEYSNLWYELKVGNYYAREDGFWQSTPTRVLYGAKSVNGVVQYEKLFRQPPIDGNLTIRFYEPESAAFTGVSISTSNISIPAAQSSGKVSFNYLIETPTQQARDRVKYITPYYSLISGDWSLKPDNTYGPSSVSGILFPNKVEYSKELVNSTASYSNDVPASPFEDIRIEFGQNVSAKFDINEVQISKLKIEYADFSVLSTLKESEELTGTNTANYKLIREPIDLGLGDTPAGWYAAGLYLDKLPIPSWTTAAGDNEQVQVLLLREILNRTQAHKQVLSCDVLGNLHFNAVIWDAYNQQRKMIPTGLSWDVKRGEWSGEFVEVLGTTVINPGEVTNGILTEASDFILLETGEYLLQE